MKRARGRENVKEAQSRDSYAVIKFCFHGIPINITWCFIAMPTTHSTPTIIITYMYISIVNPNPNPNPMGHPRIFQSIPDAIHYFSYIYKTT